MTGPRSFAGAVLAAAFVLALAAFPGEIGEVGAPPPEQPIPYSHKTHVGLGLECSHCHTIPGDGFEAGFPAEEKCMACHAAIKTDSPHIEALAKFAEAGESVPWVRIYRVPDYVWFSHASHHVDAKIACEKCHGPVAERDQMFKEKSTSMESCMQCHAEYGASNSCDFCHDPG
jgi:hypothetical protein